MTLVTIKKTLIFLVLALLFTAMAIVAHHRTRNDAIDCSETVVLKNGANPSYLDEQWDSYCSRKFLSRVAPHGIVSVFGANFVSSAHHDAYQLIRVFAKKWAEQPQAKKWPIATGGGFGIMEAATRGAREEDQGTGIALSLLIPIKRNGLVEKKSPFDLKKDSFTYRGIAKREADLINHAKAVVVGLGGLGTQGELMFTLSYIKLHKKNPTPVIVLAPKKEAERFMIGFFTLIDMGLLDKSACTLLNLTHSPEKTVQLILMPESQRERDESSACKFLKKVP